MSEKNKIKLIHHSSDSSIDDKTKLSSHIVTLRVTESEYEEIYKKAKELGWSVSQYFRNKALDLSQNIKAEKQQASSAKNSIVLSLNSLRSDFKKTTILYEKIVNETSEYFKENLNVCEFNGTVLAVKKNLDSLIELTLKSQNSLNEILRLHGQNETHTATILPVISEEKIIEATEKNTEKFKIKYCFMQKITIVGNLVSDASSYISKDKIDKMRFNVAVDSLRGKDKKTTVYSVFIEKSGLFDYLKKGRLVIVSGDLDISFRKDKEGKLILGSNGDPILDSNVFADYVKLGQEA